MTPTESELVASYEAGYTTRSELVSGLAELNIVPENPDFREEVEALKAKIASGDTFKVQSYC